MGGFVRTVTIGLDADPDDGCFTATAPALPGCIAQGATIEECVTMAQDALARYLEDLRTEGLPIPEEAAPPRLLTIAGPA